jgi:hypothetical protein
MRAIVLEKFGGPDSLVIKEIPEPEPRAVHVVIQVKAFGTNHAEMHMRRGSGPTRFTTTWRPSIRLLRMIHAMREMLCVQSSVRKRIFPYSRS